MKGEGNYGAVQADIERQQAEYLRGKERVLGKVNLEAGVKHDQGKPAWVLVPWEQMEKVVRVLMFGAGKYPTADNWKRITDRDRYLNAAYRHLVARARGERLDPETGQPHLAHLVCCALFLDWHDDAVAELSGGDPVLDAATRLAERYPGLRGPL